MAASEAALSAGLSGLSVSTPPAVALALVKSNTEVLEKLGL